MSTAIINVYSMYTSHVQISFQWSINKYSNILCDLSNSSELSLLSWVSVRENPLKYEVEFCTKLILFHDIKIVKKSKRELNSGLSYLFLGIFSDFEMQLSSRTILEFPGSWTHMHLKTQVLIEKVILWSWSVLWYISSYFA